MNVQDGLSIVVPSYQMAPYLDLTLESFRPLFAEGDNRLEVIVFDDGSTDGTREVVDRALRAIPALKYVRRDRDQRSCRSLARNLGAQMAEGRHVLFLDAGVMAPASLPGVLAHAWAEGGDDVLIVATLGLFSSRYFTDPTVFLSEFKGLSPASLVAKIRELERDRAWCDRRLPLFVFADRDGSSLPAPWLLAWSCALGVPRRLMEAIGGFDESFLNWGAEDCDFALRLHEAGAKFRFVSGAPVLHVPHPTEATDAKRAQNLVNARKMHSKRFGRESELFLVLDDPFSANLFASRLDRSDLARVLPQWTPEMVAAAVSLAAAPLDTLVIGAPLPIVVAQLPGVVWAVPNRSSWECVSRQSPATAGVRISLGCHLSEATGSRQTVILSDLLRALPAPIQVAQLREAVRVGRKAFLLCSDPGPGWLDEERIRRETEGWPFQSIDGLAPVAAAAGVVLAEIEPRKLGVRVYQLVPA